MAFEKLLSEGKIGNVTLRNRIVMTAMDVCLADLNGIPGEEAIAFYTARARGGVGLIINGLTRVDDEYGRASLKSLALTTDDNIPAFRKLTDAVHAEGAKMFCQLHHPGRETMCALNGNKYNVSASARACGLLCQTTRALTAEEIHEIVGKFVSAAVRAQKAGYDGVELHCAHGYLLQQFLSPYTNRRTDEYGGSMENRMRIVMEIIDGIHAQCGREFPISIRISADEYLSLVGNPSPCLTLEETVPMCVAFEKAGVDVINVSCGLYETCNTCIEPSSVPEGWRAYLMKAIKQAVSIPVMGVSVIRHPEFAEKLLEENNQDFICMSRTFLADPEWVKKVQEGRVCEIRKCISCLRCFESYMASVGTGSKIQCALNPMTAHEAKYADWKKDGDGRTVVVVGAGPAGLEAARVLALRGFKPVIFEKNAYAGGQLNFADKAPMKFRITELVRTMEAQLAALGVSVTYNHEATADEIRAMKPYAVIVATGSKPFTPNAIPGVDSENVYSYTDVLSGAVEPKGKRVAVVGGGHSGLETAHFLAEKGYEVSVIEMQGAIGPDMYQQNQMDLAMSLAKKNVEIHTTCMLKGIEGDTLHLFNVGSLEPLDLTADSVVISMGVRPVDFPADDLGCKVVKIGDCITAGKIGDATSTAFAAAWNL